MSALLYGAGLIIGITLFVYLYSSFQSGKEKLQKKNKPEKTTALTDAVETPAHPFRANHAPGTRVCPLCGNALTRYEALYASHIETTAGKKILIHGCRYCYKPENDDEEISLNAV